ncbi:MAG: DsbA family protein [Rhodospirillales bacterium]
MYRIILPLALGLLLPGPAPAQSEEQGITRQQADAILNELRQIRQLLEKQARPAPSGESEGSVKLKITDGNWLGKKDAPVTLVEFTDYQCSFCQRFHLATFPEIRKRYIDTGKVRFLSRDFPLQFHGNAFRAAEAARCAGDQGQFWKMRDVLVANPNRLSENDLLAHAQGLGLKMEPFKECLTTGKHRAEVQKDIDEALALKVSGTPSFIVGRTTPEGVEGVFLVGAHPFESFEQKLREFGAN